METRPNRSTSRPPGLVEIGRPQIFALFGRDLVLSGRSGANEQLLLAYWWSGFRRERSRTWPGFESLRLRLLHFFCTHSRATTLLFILLAS